MTEETDIRVVPDSEPTASGEWMRIPCEMPLTISWKRACAQVAGFVPDGHHIVEMKPAVKLVQR